MILDLLRKRCSVRNFSETAISERIISDILEAGRLSPSGGNEQPWKFGVITDKKQIELISLLILRLRK
jgi:nitroreductase